MTAINIVAQPKYGLIHVLQDAAIYTKEQGVVAYGSKSYPVAHWPGIVTGAGNCNAVPSFGVALSQGCDFDHVIESAPSILPILVESCSWVGGGQMLLSGISKSRGPESYIFRLDDSLPPDISLEDARASGSWTERPGVLLKMPDVFMTPPITKPDEIIAAEYDGVDIDESPEQVIWAMRKHMTMQRHMQLPVGIGGIGGFATLTTISSNGIEQRITDRWPDRIGGDLRPGPIDWSQWHKDNPKPVMPDRGAVHHLRAVR